MVRPPIPHSEGTRGTHYQGSNPCTRPTDQWRAMFRPADHGEPCFVVGTSNVTGVSPLGFRHWALSLDPITGRRFVWFRQWWFVTGPPSLAFGALPLTLVRLGIELARDLTVAEHAHLCMYACVRVCACACTWHGTCSRSDGSRARPPMDACTRVSMCMCVCTCVCMDGWLHSRCSCSRTINW